MERNISIVQICTFYEHQLTDAGGVLLVGLVVSKLDVVWPFDPVGSGNMSVGNIILGMMSLGKMSSDPLMGE